MRRNHPRFSEGGGRYSALPGEHNVEDETAWQNVKHPLRSESRTLHRLLVEDAFAM